MLSSIARITSTQLLRVCVGDFREVLLDIALPNTNPHSVLALEEEIEVDYLLSEGLPISSGWGAENHELCGRTFPHRKIATRASKRGAVFK